MSGEHVTFGRSFPPLKAVVAIPARDERDHIAGCLQALNRQVGAADHPFAVVLFLNNCRDGTECVVAAVAPTLSYALRVIVRDEAVASAGWARRCALEAAAAWLEESGAADGVLLTSDADSRVPADWLSRNLAALDAGADLVAGRLALDPVDDIALPAPLRARGALEAQYDALLTDLIATLDPVLGDPWPNHACHSGASIATPLRIYRGVGGMPAVPCGEDREFVEAVIAHGGLVRHDPDIVVVTSGRLLGRAEGGVADTIRRRCDIPDSPCDDRLEAVSRVAARTRWRAHLRRLHAAGRHAPMLELFNAFEVPAEFARELIGAPTFGALYLALERVSPRLAYRPVRPSALPGEIRRVRSLMRILTACERGARVNRSAFNLDRIGVEACD